MRLVRMIVASGVLLVASSAASAYRTGPFPIELHGGNSSPLMPPHEKTFRNIQAANKAVTKLRTAVDKCYAKGVANHASGKPTGITSCLNDPQKGALAKYAAAIARLAAKPGSLPPCSAFEIKAAAIADVTRALHAYAYCGPPPGSPSGAFLDGPLTY